MKKLGLLLTFVSFSSFSFAGGVIEPKTGDIFMKADTNATSSKDRSLYMPRLITPDELKSGIYAGLGLSISSLADGISPSIFSQKIGNNRMVDLSVVAGYNFNKYIAAEARGLVSVGYDEGVDFSNLGLYLKPQYEVYKDVTLYSLIGVGKIAAKNINDDKLKVGKTNLQLGVGANYKLKNNFKVFADYRYLGKDVNAKVNNRPSIMKASAITTGVTYDF